MKIKMIFWIFTILTFSSLAKSFASENPCADTTSVSQFKSGYAASEKDFPQGVFSPAGIKVDGIRAFLSTSLIYWKSISADASFYSLFAVLPNKTIKKRVLLESDYKLGCKIAGGYFIRNDWKITAEYTHLMSNVRNHQESTNFWKIIADFWFVNTSDPQTVDGHFHLTYDAAHLCLAKDYYVGRSLTFSPYFGIHGDWVFERLEGNIVDFIEQNSGFVTLPALSTNEGWLVGLRTGLDATFFITNEFKFLAKSAVNLGYHHTFIKNTVYIVNIQTLKTANINMIYEKTDLSLNAELELGLSLAYGRYFNNMKYHLEATLGYEFLTLFGQPRFADSLTRTSFFNGDDSFPLFFHGFTATLQFDF